jgi:histidine phosphotransferase ChpT
MSALDMRLSELLTARLCHELIGPIAAIGNGVELLSDEDPDFAGDALALVAQSARRASNRLQFYRFAYGFGGDHSTAGPLPFELAAGFFAETRIACDYGDSIRALPLDRQKLGCNLLLVGAEALARGGRLFLDIEPTGHVGLAGGIGAAGLRLEAVGDAAALSPETAAALMLETPAAALTSRTVQGYFAGLLARALGWRLIGAARGPGRYQLVSTALPA